MGQGMTKQQKQILSARLPSAQNQQSQPVTSARKPQPRNASNVKTVQGSCYRSKVAPTTFTVNFVDSTGADQTFSTISARKLSSFTNADGQHLRVDKNDNKGDSSSGCNSSSHAENKHEILVNRTKTPKLGIHLKSTLRECGTKKTNPAPQFRNQISSSNHLSVPGKASLKNLMGGTSSMTVSTQLSTRDVTNSANSARSSQSGSVHRLNSQDSANSDFSDGAEYKTAPVSAALEAALFSMSPR